MLLVENDAATESVIKYLKKEGFTLKINTYLDYYLSWKIMMSEDKTLCVFKSSTYLQKIEYTFGPMVRGLHNYKTPGTP